MNHSKQREELTPRTETEIHRIGMVSGILAEALEQPGDRVMVSIDRIRGEQPAVLRIKDEHEPHEDIQQPGVHLVRIVLEHAAQKVAPSVIVGGLKAAKQFVERALHLLRKLGRNGVLILAAFSEDPGQPLYFWQAEQPFRREQKMQSGKDRATGHLSHLRHGECQVSARLAAGRVYKAEVHAIEQQSDGDAGLA